MGSAKSYFRLYAHNIPVRGAARSAIYDLQRQNVVPIPNVLHGVLQQCRQAPWQQVQQQVAPNAPEVFEQYLLTLQTRDLGFFTATPDDFPDLSLRWHSPNRVQNAVLSYDFARYDVRDVLQQLDALQCRHLELRLGPPPGQVPAGPPWPSLRALVRRLQSTSLHSVTLLLAYAPALDDERQLSELYEQCAKIQHVLVHAAPASRPSLLHPGRVAYVAQDLRLVQPRNRYVVNLDYFTEAQEFNPYFNRKICVDAHGDIKNCLLQPETFGNVNTTRLATVLERAAFRELWHAAPDRTLGVQDSELRYALFSADKLVRNAATGLFEPVAPLVPELVEEAA